MLNIYAAFFKNVGRRVYHKFFFHLYVVSEWLWNWPWLHWTLLMRFCLLCWWPACWETGGGNEITGNYVGGPWRRASSSDETDLYPNFGWCIQFIFSYLIWSVYRRYGYCCWLDPEHRYRIPMTERRIASVLSRISRHKQWRNVAPHVE